MAIALARFRCQMEPPSNCRIRCRLSDVGLIALATIVLVAVALLVYLAVNRDG